MKDSRDDLSLVTYTDRDHYPERSRIMKRLWHGTAHSSVPCAKYTDDVLEFVLRWSKRLTTLFSTVHSGL
ncbi:hypothetical protein I308_100061 [Cryptococcus tetragattii IND107]|uniref:Uncharacterized protein n=1 Tax=Cryptococcus tetragattii IND107 TaxID=1296105 RepID=A0ABR3C6Y2_9TREE